MLNSAQAKELFLQEAVLFGERDGVPFPRAVKLFGKEAASFAITPDDPRDQREYYSLFGVGNYQCYYLTFNGFLKAVSYANALEVRNKDFSESADGQVINITDLVAPPQPKRRRAKA